MSGAPVPDLPTPDEIDAEISRAATSVKRLEEQFTSGLRKLAEVGVELGGQVGNALLKVGAQVLADVAKGAINDLDLLGGEVRQRVAEENARLQDRLARRRARRGK